MSDSLLFCRAWTSAVQSSAAAGYFWPLLNKSHIHWFLRRLKTAVKSDGRTDLRSTAFHCTALHCISLHCAALHCAALHFDGLHCTRLQCTGQTVERKNVAAVKAKNVQLVKGGQTPRNLFGEFAHRARAEILLDLTDDWQEVILRIYRKYPKWGKIGNILPIIYVFNIRMNVQLTAIACYAKYLCTTMHNYAQPIYTMFMHNMQVMYIVRCLVLPPFWCHQSNLVTKCCSTYLTYFWKLATWNKNQTYRRHNFNNFKECFSCNHKRDGHLSFCWDSDSIPLWFMITDLNFQTRGVKKFATPQWKGILWYIFFRSSFKTSKYHLLTNTHLIFLP